MNLIAVRVLKVDTMTGCGLSVKDFRGVDPAAAAPVIVGHSATPASHHHDISTDINHGTIALPQRPGRQLSAHKLYLTLVACIPLPVVCLLLSKCAAVGIIVALSDHQQSPMAHVAASEVR
jgi:hypothetical protein